MAPRKVSKTPLKTASFADQFGGGPALPENDTDLEQAAKKGPTTEELLARIDQMDKQMTDLSRTNAALSAPAVTVTPTVAKAPSLDLTGLPDPSFDNEGYVKGVAQRVEAFTEAK